MVKLFDASTAITFLKMWMLGSLSVKMILFFKINTVYR
jgi:hypothetical protein